MTHELGKPITRFLIALAHSSELLHRFRHSPDAVLEEWGLQKHSSLLNPDATLRQIQDAVAAEHADEGGDATAMFWILVGSAPTQPNWIQAPSTDDDQSGGGGSSAAA